MSSTRIRRSDPCTYENCGSRRFHIGDDGYTYCDQGHQQSERGTVIAEDTGEFLVYGSRSKKKDSDTESAASKASSFSGPRAFNHYLLCVQLILRKQLQWLIEIQRLPDELESLARDLWALRLQRLQSRTAYDSETDTEGHSSQVFSSQSESASGAESRGSRQKRRKGQEAKETLPSLVETLALCYLGAFLLRIPLTVADIHGWVNDGALLYYDAHRQVPLGMRERLPGKYEEQLAPQDLLKGQMLHQRIFDLITMFSTDFGMAFPSINTSLVLFRWIQDLTLPLEVFVATQRLALALSMDFTFGNPNPNVVLRYPEARLMALAVVATKLLLPFDDIERHPASITNLSTMSMNWEEWKAAHEAGRENRPVSSQLTFQEAFSFSETDCLTAADEKLDSYLAWCAENIASEDVRERGAAGKDADFRKALFGMFPLDPHARTRGVASQGTANTRCILLLRQVQESLILRTIIPPAAGGQETSRPGSSYRRFRQVVDLSGIAKSFYEKAAKSAGLSLDNLVQAVFFLERKLQKQEEALRDAAKS